MNNIKNTKKDKWIRPWNIEKFDNIGNKDERFFSILMKGILSYLNNHIILYNKPIKHFILTTGSSYMYLENDGYNFSYTETSGEDQMYMEMPRCVISMNDLTVPQGELSCPYAVGTYDRIEGKNIKNYAANIRRIPIEWNLNLSYVLSNFNESIVLLEEIINKFIWQQYFYITYLGQKIQCSIEFSNIPKIELNKTDFTTDIHLKKVEFQVKICSNYPIINERTEIPTTQVISSFSTNFDIIKNDKISDESEINYNYNMDKLPEVTQYYIIRAFDTEHKHNEEYLLENYSKDLIIQDNMNYFILKIKTIKELFNNYFLYPADTDVNLFEIPQEYLSVKETKENISNNNLNIQKDCKLININKYKK